MLKQTDELKYTEYTVKTLFNRQFKPNFDIDFHFLEHGSMFFGSF